MAGNTGRIHVGRGFPPTPTVGEPLEGTMLTQTGEVSERKQFESDTVFQGDIWLIASIAAQLVEVEETLS